MAGTGGDGGFVVRPARTHDLLRVAAIDAESAVLPGAMLERAAPGELEHAIEVGDVLIAAHDRDVVGYVHLDRQSHGAVYLTGLVVVPWMRGRGCGAALLTAALTVIGRSELPVYTMTSPGNLAMLKLLFDRGFVGPWGLPHFFGPDLHRIGMRLARPGDRRPPATSWRRADNFESWATVLAAGYAVVQAIVRGGRPLLGITRFPLLDGSDCVRRFTSYQLETRFAQHAALRPE